MKTGDKVVCINVGRCWCPQLRSDNRKMPPLKLNAVYVVKGTGVVPYGNIVNLVGVDPSPHLGFHPDRFILLSEMKAKNNTTNQIVDALNL